MPHINVCIGPSDTQEVIWQNWTFWYHVLPSISGSNAKEVHQHPASMEAFHTQPLLLCVSVQSLGEGDENISPSLCLLWLAIYAI